MGPESGAIMAQFDAGEIEDLSYFRHCRGNIGGIDVDAVRLSFVGEAGWELTCATPQAVPLYRLLHAAGAQPAGLFAQTSMRIEKRFLSFGHDLDTDLNPLQAGLEFSLDWDSDFIGKAALSELRASAPSQRLVSILFDDPQAQPLGHEPVYLDGAIIGKTTSAEKPSSPTRPPAICMWYMSIRRNSSMAHAVPCSVIT